MEDANRDQLPSNSEIAEQQAHPQYSRVLDILADQGLDGEYLKFSSVQVIAGIEAKGLLIRPPVAMDLEVLDEDAGGNPVSRFRRLMERLVGVGEGELDYLIASDYIKMTDWVNRFLLNTQ